jgi:hypothetical protein
MDDKIKVIIYNGGRPLKTTIGGLKTQIPDGIRELPHETAQEILKQHGNIVKLYKDVDVIQSEKKDKPAEVAAEAEPVEIKKKGRPKKA